MNKTISNAKIGIVGSGPAGMSAALFLANMGIPSILIEKQVFPRDKICGDALSGKVVSVLKKLKPEIFSEMIISPRFEPCYGIKFVSPHHHSVHIAFKKEFYGSETSINPSGFVSPRLEFDHFLFQEVEKSTLVQIKQNTTIEKYTRTPSGYQVTYSDGSTQQFSLLIICDGAQSTFARKHAGLIWDDSHFCGGLRQYFQGVSPGEQSGFLELYFFKDVLPGYFWIFPLGNGKANVGLGMRKDHIKKSRTNLNELLKTIITQQPDIKKRFEQATAMENPKGFGLPLGSARKKIYGAHYMLCGDAASLIDPFTGEGISNALISGMLAAQTAQFCIQKNDFSEQTLKQYQHLVNQKIGQELKLSTWLQKMAQFPWLFDLVVKKANNNQEVRETITSMFDQVDLRSKFKDPLFYWKLLK